MHIYYTRQFEREYKKLPQTLKDQAKRREKVFRADPFDPRLRTHKLKGEWKDFWSFSITHSHRIIFEFRDDKIVYFQSIGDHSVYQ